MFSVGDTVIYGTQGVCKIKECSLMKFGGEKKEYLVLAPVSDEKSVVYVPAESPVLLKKMRKVLSKPELDALLEETASEQHEWIIEDNKRRDYCDEVIKGGNRRDLLLLIEMLYLHREELKPLKKHFHNADAQYLKAAERLLHDEFAFVLGISPEDVPEYIKSNYGDLQ